MPSEQLSASKKMLSSAAIALVLTGCTEKQTDAEAPTPGGQAAIMPTSVKSGQLGYDVSWPQGDQGLKPPQTAPFVIVGLNHDVANDWNEYFAEQSVGAIATYVHTANPGREQARTWPTSGRNRYGSCAGDDSLACDYEYGRTLAEDDLAHAAKYNAETRPFWLDVEVENYSWQNELARNRVALEGMVKAFTDHGNAVGIYSDTQSFARIAGELPPNSELQGLPNWILGAGVHTEAAAQENCQAPGFTGEVVLAQMAGDAFPIDRNYVC